MSFNFNGGDKGNSKSVTCVVVHGHIKDTNNTRSNTHWKTSQYQEIDDINNVKQQEKLVDTFSPTCPSSLSSLKDQT